MSIYSTYWYRVEDIKPRLRPHVNLSRHVYRNKNWYVIQDPSTGRQQRFNEGAYYIIGLMDGERTVREIWESANTTQGDNAPTQDEMIHLLGQLHLSDVLQSNISPDSIELFERQRRQRKTWTKRLANPFALKFPLVDPDRFLSRWVFVVQPLLSRGAFFIWLLVVGAGIILGGMHWQELTHNMVDRVFLPENLLILWCVYPIIKLFHELGHAFAIKHWGGEVHEMGIMMLAFTPIPYVEASSSAVFPDKKKRMTVAAAGMGVELFLASLALFLWLNVESGLLSAVAYNVILIGSVSTLLFNGNPLLRFDGYYVLSDWIEIPNLAKRSVEYLGYLLKRYIFGMVESRFPVTAPGERGWFFVYGIASFCYRMFILATLALMISGKFFVVGILVALWAIWSQVVVPAVTRTYRFISSIDGRRKRGRIFGVVACACVLIGIVLFVVPAPFRSTGEGVVTLSEQSLIRVGTDCFIVQTFVESNSQVLKGDPLFRCEDPLLDAEIAVLQAKYEEAFAKYRGEPLQSRVTREILKEKLEAAQADLVHAQEKEQQLIVTSPGEGLLVFTEQEGFKGRFVKQGDLLGYIVGPSYSTVVAVVEQADIALVKERTSSVQLRFASKAERPITATINREIPAASQYLPSPVLGVKGGGVIPVLPEDPEGVQTFAKTFQVEIRLPFTVDKVRIGERVYVLFNHGYEPLARQWYLMARRLFLRHFHV